MKVYLGGKMSGGSRGDNWRNALVDSSAYHLEGNGDFVEANGIDLTGSCGDGEPPIFWPILPKAILGRFDYVGPYLVSCDHGCFHSGDHATSVAFGEEELSDWRDRKDDNRQRILALCKDSMAAADILFFWFDSLDAYGTLAELLFSTTFVGTANALLRRYRDREIKKHYIVASPSFMAIDEMWLAFRLLRGHVQFVEAPTPKSAFESAIAGIEDAYEYSPIEKKFIETWRILYGNGISTQYNVPGFRYRVDFAFPEDKVAIELDGYEYHNSKEQFTKDRQRQREMELAGWRFVRFSGSEIYKDVIACVRSAHAFWNSCIVEKVAHRGHH